MVKFTKIVLATLLFFLISSNFIISHNTGEHDEFDHDDDHHHDHDHDDDHHHDHDHDHDHNHEGYEHENEEANLQKNLFDEEGNEIIAFLGFDKKETLNKQEMRTIFEKIFFKRDMADDEEKLFFNNLIENIVSSLPETVESKNLRNYFEIEYLMKFIDGFGEQPVEEEPSPKDSL